MLILKILLLSLRGIKGVIQTLSQSLFFFVCSLVVKRNRASFRISYLNKFIHSLSEFEDYGGNNDENEISSVLCQIFYGVFFLNSSVDKATIFCEFYLRATHEIPRTRRSRATKIFSTRKHSSKMMSRTGITHSTESTE